MPTRGGVRLGRLVSASALWAVAASAPALAARPLVTDDARVVDPGACQLETWTRTGDQGTEVWALPACSAIGNLELTAGVGVLPDVRGEGPETAVVQLQAKSLFRPLGTGRLGYGLAVGSVLRTEDALDEDLDVDLLGEVYAYAPVSVMLSADRAWLHLNAGVRHDRGDAGTRMLWGAAAEVLVGGPVFALAETYGDAPGPSFMQVGLRVTLVPDRLQIDSTYGRRLPHGADDEWATVGLRFLSPTLFEPLGTLDWAWPF